MVVDVAAEKYDSTTTTTTTTSKTTHINDIVHQYQQGVSAFLIRDTVSITPKKPHYRVDPTLLVLKPDPFTFDQLVTILRRCDYRFFLEWYDSGEFRNYLGSMTVKGLLAYYYDRISPNTAFDLDRFAYNNMADHPTIHTGIISTTPTPLPLVCRSMLKFVANAVRDCN